VRIVQGSRNDRAIHSSKAVGEPPFFLGASCFFAIRDAVAATRTGYFEMESPATSERIRMACVDDITRLAKTEGEEGEKSWSIRT
jgi:xanthine dehydrogenase/oxidase